MGLNEVYQEFLDDLVTRTDFPKERIVELLKEKFNGFVAKDIPKYRNYVLTANAQQMEKEFQEETKSRLRKESDIVPFPQCPICGADTIGEPKLYNKYTKEQGWTCKKGGNLHFRMWNSNRILERKNLPQIFGIPDTEQVVDRKVFLRMDFNDYEKIATKLKGTADYNYIINLIQSLVGRMTIVIPEPTDEILEKAILAIKEWTNEHN